jgi:hypothetical protein
VTASEAVYESDGTLVYGQSEELHQYGMANGIPPIAAKLVLIDFDGTIVPWGPLMGDKDPTPGAVEAISALREAGFRIGIFTSRLSKTWARSVVGSGAAVAKFLVEQEQYVRVQLDRHGIPFDFITAEKMPAEVYFDDKAVGVNEDFPLSSAIHRWLKEGLS